MVEIEKLGKVFSTARGSVQALDEVSFSVRKGEFVIIHGPSGSGKSTLLFTIGGMLRPTSGHVAIDGQDVYAMSPQRRAGLRARSIGFVFQMFHLVPYLNVRDNVVLPAEASGRRARTCRAAAGALLDRLHLSDRAFHRPAQLSAGERQRAAIARALLPGPELILADEPTGNLDPENAEQIFEIFHEFHLGGGTVVMVTHGQGAERHADRVLHLRNGKLVRGE